VFRTLRVRNSPLDPIPKSTLLQVFGSRLLRIDPYDPYDQNKKAGRAKHATVLGCSSPSLLG